MAVITNYDKFRPPQQQPNFTIERSQPEGQEIHENVPARNSETESEQASSSNRSPNRERVLAISKDPEFILRNFKTMHVNAAGAKFFGTPQMKAALGQNEDFSALKVTIVDDPAVADVVLDVHYTFAWDYPFSLTDQKTSVVLFSGKASVQFPVRGVPPAWQASL